MKDTQFATNVPYKFFPRSQNKKYMIKRHKYQRVYLLSNFHGGQVHLAVLEAHALCDSKTDKTNSFSVERVRTLLQRRNILLKLFNATNITYSTHL